LELNDPENPKVHLFVSVQTCNWCPSVTDPDVTPTIAPRSQLEKAEKKSKVCYILASFPFISLNIPSEGETKVHFVFQTSNYLSWSKGIRIWFFSMLVLLTDEGFFVTSF
jgi:hypothetical protein